MTTIAYRNGIVAADTRVTVDDGDAWATEQRKIEKVVWKGIGGIVTVSILATTGSVFETGAWVKWRKDLLNGYGGLPPEPLGSDGDGGQLIEFRFDGTRTTLHVWDISNGLSYSWPIGKMDYYAFGSGDRYALGAMADTANAYRAVMAASKHDPRTGGPIQTLNLFDKEPEDAL